jgi:hypothetical protein
MSSDEVQILKRSVDALRDEVSAMRGTMAVIHEAVMGMAGKVYVPGPPTKGMHRSFWDRLRAWF